MKRSALLPLLFFLISPAGAFFWSSSDKRAGELLAQMRSAYGAGDCQASIELSEKLLAEKPPRGMREEAYGYMGLCYDALGSADKAISLYKLALGLYPENIHFSYRLALIYNESGFHQLAAPLFLDVLKAEGDNIEANLGLARAYAAQGFLTKAKEYYSRAVILQDFGDVSALEEYARCMLRKGDWAEALLIAGKGAEAAPRSAVWRLLEARVQAGRGEYYKAIDLAESAIALEPSRSLRLERALYLLLGGLPKRALAAAEGELSGGQDALASMIKGMALYSMGRREEARPHIAAGRGAGPFAEKMAAALLGEARESREEACKK